MKRVFTWTLLSSLLCLVGLIGMIGPTERKAPANKTIKKIVRSGHSFHEQVKQSPSDLIQ